ncbi:MAG: PrsW family glutamic-type intramembrane protease [Eubacterium sp.]|nr:PrsW family glutamic-type intramembrane protease [Eubacterium sp.]
MTYIENTYVCLAAPLLIAILYLRGVWRRALIFLLAGMTCCVLAAYVNSFLAMTFRIDASSMSYEIIPAIEEILKFLPVLFYLLVFDPKKSNSINGIVVIAVGFATFENVCFMTSYGTSEILRLLIRGFGTGAMHVVCGMMIAIGLYYLWERTWLRAVGVFAVLCSAITFHAIFNILIKEEGVSLWVGSAIPIVILLTSLIFYQRKQAKMLLLTEKKPD